MAGGIDADALAEEWEQDELGDRRRSKKLSVKAQEQLGVHDVARVVTVDRGRVTVLLDGAEVQARFSGAMRGTKVLVADEVRVKPPKHDNDQARIVGLLDRTTTLTRTADDDLDDERVVVANADQVVVVLTAEWLEGGIGFLDRVLVAASAGGLAPILCINKMDLVEPGSERAGEVAELAERYRVIGYPVVCTSASEGTGLDELAALLAGHWTAFAGHSGVGKTSLFNALVPGIDRAVAEVGRRGGRHTTVASRAHHITSIDAWLIDTPGVRSFGLAGVEVADLADHFPEFEGLSQEQRFALENAAEAPEGVDIHPDRLAFYRRLRTALTEPE